MKKIVPITFGIILLALIIFGIWFFFFKDRATEDPLPFETYDGFGSFFNINGGNNETFVSTSYTDPLELNEVDPENRPPIIRQLSSEPVSGYTISTREFEFIDISATTTEERVVTEERFVFRFMERATGHIYEAREDKMIMLRLSNETIPKVTKTNFLEGGRSMLYEQLGPGGENINSYFAKFERTSTSTDDFALNSEPYSIISSNFTSSPKQNLFAYTIKDNDGSSVFIDNVEQNLQREIYSSPIKEWLLDWETPDKISLKTKPSSGEPGYMFLLDTNSGLTQKILNRIVGMVAKLSPSGERVLYSANDGNKISMFSKNIETGEISTVYIATLPEKCVFKNEDESIVYCGAQTRIPSGTYPDDWYKGKVSFIDHLWEINTSNNLIRNINTFNDYEVPFDMIDLKLTPDNRFLVFINRNDLTLWSIDLERLAAQETFIPESPEAF